MKKCIVFFAALSCLLSGAMAEQRVGPFVTGMMSAGDDSGSAFGGGLKYEWLFSENLGLDVHAGYLSDSDIGLMSLAVGPTLVFPIDSVSLSLGAGALYGIPQDSDADAALGFYAGVGIRGPLSDGVEWFIEGQYASIEGDENTETRYYSRGYTITSEEHLDFSAAGMNVGVLWKF